MRVNKKLSKVATSASIVLCLIGLTLAQNPMCDLSQYQCNNSLALNYRTINGLCNNLVQPWIGSVRTPMKRFQNAPSAYSSISCDPVSIAADGTELPPSREVAMHLNFPEDVFIDLNVFYVQFGQVLAHDISNSVNPGDEQGRALQCFCNDTSNPLCMVLPTTKDDTVNQDQDCMGLPRTVGVNYNWNCETSAYREQINGLTSWLDNSNIYGYNLPGSQRIRNTTESGFLKVRQIEGLAGPVFPRAASGSNQCLRDSIQFPCFQGGEARTNENLILAGIQVLLFRQHNLIAKILKSQNGWTGEKLYQETKKIINGFYQHITYSEWLPLTIGPKMMEEYDLYPRTSGYTNVYQSTVAAQTINEFTTAAFRFGHNMVPSIITKADSNLKTFKSFNLSQISWSPGEGYIDGGLDAIVRGAITNRALMGDHHFSDQLQDHLFDVGVVIGDTKRNSLSAFNIQRGRDHGIQPYNFYRNLSKLNFANSFEDLSTNIDASSIDLLKSVYGSVNDIDLYIGGSFETNLPGANLGQTFAS